MARKTGKKSTSLSTKQLSLSIKLGFCPTNLPKLTFSHTLGRTETKAAFKETAPPQSRPEHKQALARAQGRCFLPAVFCRSERIQSC